jgi:CRP-like cAMP-binding protein
MHYKNPFIQNCIEGPYSIFRNLASKEKEILIQNHAYAIYRKGEIVMREGEKPYGLLSLASGKVKIFKEGVGGREQILRMIRPQGFIGYRAMFAEGIYCASAIALEDSAVCIFEKSCIISLIRNNPDLSLRFMKVLANDLGFSANRTISLTQKHVRGRIAESLIVLRDTYGYEDDGKTINIYLSREDLASLSNMTTSNAIRTLSNLASEKIIALKGKKIAILDDNKLEQVSELG